MGIYLSIISLLIISDEMYKAGKIDQEIQRLLLETMASIIK